MTPFRLGLARARDLRPGEVLHRVALPPVTSTQLAFYCAASRVADPIHYDREFARRFGFRDLVVNGSLRIAWLTRALADLVAPPDYVAQLRCAHRGPMFVGEAIALEVQVSAAAGAAENGFELPCTVTGRVGDTIVDQGDGILLFVQR